MARGTAPGQGDGNWLIDGTNGSSNYGFKQATGETGGLWNTNGFNYFGLSGISQIDTACMGCVTPSNRLSVSSAYNIDSKIDDGYPQSGTVLAQFLQGTAIDYDGTASASVAVAASSTTCFDNNSSTSTRVAYSVGQNSGNGLNCALTFKFK